MKISEMKTTPLRVPYKKPFHSAYGVVDSAEILLVEVSTNEGLTGVGECIASPSAKAIQSYVEAAGKRCIGRSPFENSRLMGECYGTLFQNLGIGSTPRFSGQVLAGLEMALWDLMGKATDRSVHELLGGAVQDDVAYFGFPTGETPEQVAAEAGEMAAAGHEVIYVKVGRGDALDIEIVRQTRAAIGPDKRLRMDANENWSPVRARRMMRKMHEFDIDMFEQPTNAESVTALAQIRANSPVAIAADQVVFTPYDAFNVCREKAADIIVLGLHETGGIARFRKVAHIAEAAGIDICIHGLYETGITTVASHHVAATLPNLDDGNQIMNHLLQWDIIKSPDLSLENGRLKILSGPGLGFELDTDAVAQAYENYLQLR